MTSAGRGCSAPRTAPGLPAQGSGQKQATAAPQAALLIAAAGDLRRRGGVAGASGAPAGSADSALPFRGLRAAGACFRPATCAGRPGAVRGALRPRPAEFIPLPALF